MSEWIGGRTDFYADIKRDLKVGNEMTMTRHKGTAPERTEIV